MGEGKRGGGGGEGITKLKTKVHAQDEAELSRALWRLMPISLIKMKMFF